MGRFLAEALATARQNRSAFAQHFDHSELNFPVVHKFRTYFLTDDILNTMRRLSKTEAELLKDVKLMLSAHGIRDENNVRHAYHILRSLHEENILTSGRLEKMADGRVKSVLLLILDDSEKLQHLAPVFAEMEQLKQKLRKHAVEAGEKAAADITLALDGFIKHLESDKQKPRHLM